MYYEGKVGYAVSMSKKRIYIKFVTENSNQTQFLY